jgi:hypothetical protein
VVFKWHFSALPVVKGTAPHDTLVSLCLVLDAETVLKSWPALNQVNCYAIVYRKKATSTRNWKLLSLHFAFVYTYFLRKFCVFFGGLIGFKG